MLCAVIGLQESAATGPLTAAWLLDEGQGVLWGPKSKEAARAGAIAGMSSALSLTQASSFDRNRFCSTLGIASCRIRCHLAIAG